MLVGVAFSALLKYRRDWIALPPVEDSTPAIAVHRRRTMRRYQISLMLGLLGLGLAIGQLIPPKTFPTAFVLCWCLLGLLTLWTAALALGELLSVQREQARLIGRLEVERAALQRDYLKAKVAAELPPPEAPSPPPAGEKNGQH